MAGSIQIKPVHQAWSTKPLIPLKALEGNVNSGRWGNMAYNAYKSDSLGLL